MLKRIRHADVYAPEAQGMKDIFIADERIVKVADQLDVPPGWEVEEIDASGQIAVPGFIDSHVHIAGGGGEGSFHTRTPELTLTDATVGGVTTVIGVLGTDGTTRTMTNLVAKARALEEEGISCWVHTGSYQVPVKTITGKIEDDIILVDKVIGAGEIAIADHRSSQPTPEELARIASAARIGGILSGKAGIVNVHVGDSRDHLRVLEAVVEQTDIPIGQFVPTHINRNPHLFEAGIRYALQGGYVDFTTSTIPQFLEEGEVRCSAGLRRMLEAGVNVKQITFTSDGQASLPAFDEKGRFAGLQVGKVATLFPAVREAVRQEGIPLEQAIQVITSNPADILKLKRKGRIAVGMDADLVLLDKDSLLISTVLARGRVMVQAGKAVVRGTFEN